MNMMMIARQRRESNIRLHPVTEALTSALSLSVLGNRQRWRVTVAGPASDPQPQRGGVIIIIAAPVPPALEFGKTPGAAGR
jgi:hypothetical protein